MRFADLRGRVKRTVWMDIARRWRWQRQISEVAVCTDVSEMALPSVDGRADRQCEDRVRRTTTDPCRLGLGCRC